MYLTITYLDLDCPKPYGLIGSIEVQGYRKVNSMSESVNEKTVKSFIDGINRQNIKALENLFSEDLVVIYPDLRKEDKTDYLKHWAHEWGAFPDGYATIEHILSKGDIVMTEWHWKGTWKKEYQGRPPTNKAYESIPGVFVIELENAKIKLIRYYWLPQLLFSS